MMMLRLCKNLAADVTENLEYYQKVLFVVTQMKSTNVASWLEEQFLQEKRGDEWTVFCLSRLYNCHTMINNKKHSWCTIEEGGNLDYKAACDTHLLYIGNNMYGELLPKSMTCLSLIPNLRLSTPSLPKPTDATTSKVNTTTDSHTSAIGTDGAEFPNSIPDINSSSTTTNRDPADNTEYDGELDQMLLQASNNTATTETCPVHPGCCVDNSPIKQGSEVTTTLAILKRQCKVNLQQLTTAEINEWTIKSRNQPVSSSGGSTALDSDDDMCLSRLRRSHTAKKIPISPQPCFPHKTKTGVHYEETAASGDTSDNSPARKKKKVNPLLLPGPSSDHLHVQGYIIRNKSKETPNEKEQTDNTQASKTDTSENDNNKDPAQDQTPPKGNLKVTTHGLVNPQKVRRFICHLCEVVATSRRELNEHHKAEHDKVTCPKCDKEFNTPSSQDRHMYSHKDDLKFSCTKCVKCFAFESQLRSHIVIHRKLATLKCNRSLPGGGICKKWFKRDGALKKLMRVPDQHLWKCAICNYSTFDERNLKQHHRRHTGEKPFKCPACNKAFVYWTQRSHHKCDN